jgi:CheY-like chemotaxis protein
MVRALRREYLYWCLRFVELPAGKVSAAQMEEIKEMLEGLPSWVKEEPDLVLDGQGAISVPRLVPIPDPSEQLESTILVEQASVSIDRVVRVSKMSPIVAAFASCANGTRLIGLQIADTGNAVLDLDLDSMVEVPEGVIFGPDDIDSVAGLVTALLALPALASLRRLPTAKLRAPSVLVTHADTPIGSVVRQLLEREGVSVTATSESVSLLDLATGKGKFDLLVSGYEEDSAHAQVLRATRRFFWEIELPRYLSQMPTRISDVLAAVFSKRYQDIHVPGALLPVSILGAPSDKLVGGKKGGAVFSAEKTYVLLGGLGNIGAHMALYLFQVRRLPNPLYFTDLVPQARSAPHHCYLPLRRKDACSPRRGHCSQDLRVPPLATKPLHPHRSDRRIVPSRDVGAVCLDSQGAPSRRSYRSCSRSAR